jgi:hypothetical protein
MSNDHRALSAPGQKCILELKNSYGALEQDLTDFNSHAHFEGHRDWATDWKPMNRGSSSQ